jgi:hypothetical protein
MCMGMYGIRGRLWAFGIGYCIGVGCIELIRRVCGEV